MYRIDNSTAATSIPTPAAIGPNPNGYFTRGNPGTGTPATIVDDDWANAVQEEISYVIETGAGLTLSKTVRTQLYQAIRLLDQISIYATSSSSANTYTATVSPAPVAYAAGQLVFIKFTNHNTGAATINLNSLGAKAIKRLDGSSLSANDIADGMIAALNYDGTNFQLLNQNPVNFVSYAEHQNDSPSYAASGSAANTYTASLTPAPTAYTAGMRVSILITNHNTGAATINLNSLGAKSIKRLDGTALLAYDIYDGMMTQLIYDGTNFQLLNPNGLSVAQIQNQTYSYSTSSSSANTYTSSLAVAPSAYTAGMRVSIKFTNHNTGAATINLNSLGAKSITLTTGSALASGNIADGMIAEMVYDGTNFQLLNPVVSVSAGSGIDVTSGAVSRAFTLHSISTTTTLTGTDFSKTIACTGSSSYAVTLPAVSGNSGKFIEFLFAPTSGALVTLTPASGTIAGQTTVSYGAHEGCVIYCDGTNWMVIWQRLQPAAFMVTPSANTVLTLQTTLYKITHNTVAHDIGSFFDTSNNWYLPKYPGRYYISSAVRWLITNQPTGSYVGNFLNLPNSSSVTGYYNCVTASGSTNTSYNYAGGEALFNGSTDKAYVESAYDNAGVGSMTCSTSCVLQGFRISNF